MGINTGTKAPMWDTNTHKSQKKKKLCTNRMQRQLKGRRHISQQVQTLAAEVTVAILEVRSVEIIAISEARSVEIIAISEARSARSKVIVSSPLEPSCRQSPADAEMASSSREAAWRLPGDAPRWRRGTAQHPLPSRRFSPVYIRPVWCKMRAEDWSGSTCHEA